MLLRPAETRGTPMADHDDDLHERLDRLEERMDRLIERLRDLVDPPTE